MDSLYDTIGVNYANLRMPDTRIANQIHETLGQAQTVLNVGAGTGSYEPVHMQVTAIEPSEKMISQRPLSASNVIQGHAENLPFEGKSFDASMAVLTIHHWSDQEKGVMEMRRVTKGPIVFLTFDPDFREFWLIDYFPALETLDDKHMPQLKDYEKWLGNVDVSTVPIPYDCTDGFLASYWKRPTAYLDKRIRMAISSFWAIGDITDGLERLEADIESGAWAQRYSHLLDLNELDCGYRLVTAY